MKVVHISTSDMGGAGIAAKRLHLALLAAGISSSLLTLHSYGERVKGHFLLSETIERSFLLRIRERIRAGFRHRMPWIFFDESKYLKGRPPGFEKFSFPYGTSELKESQLIREADIVHLHWVADGMLDYRSFFRETRKKIVWTLHDMNPFTGGCHHSDGSMEFRKDCLDCRQVKGTIDESIASQNLSVKLSAMKDISERSLVVVTPSRWLGGLSSQSRLLGRFTHTVIPNPVQESDFPLMNRDQARRRLGIPASKKVVLFVANDISNQRKGTANLLAAVNAIIEPDLLVCTVGKPLSAKPPGIELREFGFVTSPGEMAAIYSGADVFVLPSLAENFPNTIPEALLCGVPVVATAVGGVPEQVNDLNGLLVHNNEPKTLAAAIRSVLESGNRYDPLTIRADAVKRFAGNSSVEAYIAVYRQLHEPAR
jgi:glycosyltransferase involved in cell wall biosynthesis